MEYGVFGPSVWSNISQAFRYVFLLTPLWLPIIFLVILFENWLRYKQEKYRQKEGSVLLEIKLPREIHKSPAAMEMVLNSVHQAGKEGTWIDRIWKGQTRAEFSLEIISLGGKIRFFISTRPTHRNAIETHIYSQYPGVEIYEAEDYAKPFYYDPEKTSIWAIEHALTKADAYPIKTYIDYGLDRDPKEEYKIDPMTPMLEFMGSMTEGHNIFLQILIRAHKKRRSYNVFGEKEDSWNEGAQKEIKSIMQKLKDEGTGSFPRAMTDGEKETVASLERSTSKFSFDCGIRSVYIADKDKFDGANIGGAIGMVKQFGAPGFNGFKPSGWFSGYDYFWQDWLYPKEPIKYRLLDEYKFRRLFFSPWKNKQHHVAKPFVLNTEELATIFHFPGEIAATPTLEKIPSVKAKAPSNLPI